MVTVHGGHGWLSPSSSSRKIIVKTSGAEARRIAPVWRSHCDRIHEICGKGYPVEMRISGSEVFEGGYGVEGGIEQATFLEGHAT